MGARRLVGRMLAGSCVCLLGFVAVPAAAQATITISDPQVNESDGAQSVAFLVTRKPSFFAGPLTIGWKTSDGTARAGKDYTAAEGGLSFPRSNFGQAQTQMISVQILGDTIPEDTEAFDVTLTGNEIIKPVGAVTIFDNDPPYLPPPRRNVSTTTIHEQLLARTPGGGAPNADASEPVLSWDARSAVYASYTSSATDIALQTDGKRNVFLVRRAKPIGRFGSKWKYGTVLLASAGLGGAPADGDSYAPALDGWTKGDTPHKPTCLGFVSEATNLVAGDANGRADAFVRTLKTGALRRIEAPAAVTDVAVAGDCTTVAVVADGTLYTRRGASPLRKIAAGGVTAPDLTFNGSQISYSTGGRVIVNVVGGGRRLVGVGANPTSDGGRPAGKIRYVAYERDGSTFISTIRGAKRRIAAGSMPAMTAGGTQVMFASGPYVYLYARSNRFGKVKPVGYCPKGQGYVNHVYTSARGNYVVFSCTGGYTLLSYIGPK